MNKLVSEKAKDMIIENLKKELLKTHNKIY